jgi:hypothetical protein
MMSRLQALTTRPIAITEAASSSRATVDDVSAKSRWIADFFNYVATSPAKMSNWFNSDKETDWAVFGGSTGDDTFTSSSGTTYHVYDAYKAAVSSGSLTGADTTNPRLLTDAQFQGR